MARVPQDEGEQGGASNPNATGAVMTPVKYQCADAYDGVLGNGMEDSSSDEGDYVAAPFKGRFGDGK